MMFQIQSNKSSAATLVKHIEVPLDGGLQLKAVLAMPTKPKAVIVFAAIDEVSSEEVMTSIFLPAGLATVRLELMTTEEKDTDRRTQHVHFDIAMLAHRLEAACHLLATDPDTNYLPIGCCGMGIVSAAASVACVHEPNKIQSLVLINGRPDLAYEAINSIKCPTLLVVGELDSSLRIFNEDAFEELRCQKNLLIVPDAGREFQADDSFEVVAKAVRDFFLEGLVVQPLW